MSAHYIRFDSAESFDVWHAEVNAAMGLPNSAQKTERYTYCFLATDNNLYAPVNEQCPAEFLVGFTLHDVTSVQRKEA